jgi:hypothetical protein
VGRNQGWDADEWAKFREDDWGPFNGDPEDYPEDVALANAQEISRHERLLERMDSYCRGVGVEPVRTMGQLLDLMVSCGVVLKRTDGPEPVYQLNPEALLPQEVLPLSDEDREHEDRLRWEDVHEATAHPVIKLFEPHGEMPLESMTTSLARLARTLGSDFESVRAGLTNLLESGEFTTTIDIAGAGPNDEFVLAVDWELFWSKRVTLRFAGALDVDYEVDEQDGHDEAAAHQSSGEEAS